MPVFDEEFFKKLREKVGDLIDVLKAGSPLAVIVFIIVVVTIFI